MSDRPNTHSFYSKDALFTYIYICTKNRSYAVFMDVCVKNYGGYAFHVI